MENDLPVAIFADVYVLFGHAFSGWLDTSRLYSSYRKAAMGAGKQCGFSIPFTDMAPLN